MPPPLEMRIRQMASIARNPKASIALRKKALKAARLGIMLQSKRMELAQTPEGHRKLAEMDSRKEDAPARD